MMHKLLVGLIFIYTCSYAQEFQFGVIEDKEGYVNLRATKELKDNVVDQIKDGVLVGHFGAEGNWIDITYKKNGAKETGYVYHDRVKSIESFKKIKQDIPKENVIVFQSDKVYVKIVKKKFEYQKHSITYFKEYPTFIEKIDDKEIFGTDGNMPVEEYESIEIEIDSKKILFPKSAYENLFEPNLEATTVNYDRSNIRLFIQAMNSDAAGSYAVIWMFENGVYKSSLTAIPF